MKRKTFEELVGSKLRPYYRILIRFRDFADMPLSRAFQGCPELWSLFCEVCPLNEEATAYQAAKEIHACLARVKKHHGKYSDEELRACRAMYYFCAAVAKQILKSTCEVFTGIERSFCLDELKEFSRYYGKVAGERAPFENEAYEIVGESGCYVNLVRCVIYEMEGDTGRDWTKEGVPVPAPCDIFFIPKLLCLFNAIYLILIIPLIAAKDEAFIRKVKVQGR